MLAADDDDALKDVDLLDVVNRAREAPLKILLKEIWVTKSKSQNEVRK